MKKYFVRLNAFLRKRREAKEERAKARRQKERELEAKYAARHPPIAHPNISHSIHMWVDEDGELRVRPKSRWVG